MMTTKDQPLIFERSKPGRVGHSLPTLDITEQKIEDLIPSEFLREVEPELPEVSELEIMRHYTALSKRNHGVDSGFYPLGYCTNIRIRSNIDPIISIVWFHSTN